MGFNNIQCKVVKHLREAWLSLWPRLWVWDTYFHRRPKPVRGLDGEHSQDKLKYYWYCAVVVWYCVIADFPPHWNTTFLSCLLTHQLKVCGLPAATVKSAIRGSQSKSSHCCHWFYFIVTYLIFIFAVSSFPWVTSDHNGKLQHSTTIHLCEWYQYDLQIECVYFRLNAIVIPFD